jgi:hypothetical protein
MKFYIQSILRGVNKNFMNKTILGTVSILIKDRHNKSTGVNELLNKEGSLIRARLGVNIEPKCSADCLAVIGLVVEGAEAELSGFTAKLNGLPGVKAELVKLAVE